MTWAQTPTGVIGRDGAMPWHVPEDLAHFRRLTEGHPVIMGRKTWESFPEQFQPLPGRTNIVLSRTLAAHPEAAAALETKGAVVVGDFGAALRAAAEVDGLDEVWVIGGATLYEQALDVAELAEITVIDADEDGDTHAPTLDGSWQRTAQQPEDGSWESSRTGTRYRFETWRRTGATTR